MSGPGFRTPGSWCRPRRCATGSGWTSGRNSGTSASGSGSNPAARIPRLRARYCLAPCSISRFWLPSFSPTRRWTTGNNVTNYNRSHDPSHVPTGIGPSQTYRANHPEACTLLKMIGSVDWKPYVDTGEETFLDDMYDKVAAHGAGCLNVT